jgi:hypothetical protein
MVYYIRESKLASRTKQDAYVIGLLDNFIHVAADGARREQQIENRGIELLRDPIPCFQYDFKSAAHTTCIEEEKRKISAVKELDSDDQDQIKIDKVTLNDLRPKLKADFGKFCAGPSLLDVKLTSKP